MDAYVNAEKVAVAYGLHKDLKAAGLGHIEHYLLITLAKRMGRETDIETGELLNGCRPSHDFLEETDVILERKAIGKYIGHLEEKGFIRVIKDRHRAPEGELTKEGKRRVSRGLPLDDGSDANNYQKRPMGRPRKDGKVSSQWQHCCYFATPVWDTVKFDEPKKRKDKSAPVVSSDVSVADRAVLDSFDQVPETKSTAPESKSAISNEEFDTVLKIVNVEFIEHPVWSEENHRDLVGIAIHELGRRAIQAGHLYRGVEFLDWLYMHRRSTFDFLGNSEKFGGALMKIVTDNWDQFIDSGYKDDQYYESSTEESSDPVNEGDEYVQQAYDALRNRYPAKEVESELGKSLCEAIADRARTKGDTIHVGNFVAWVRSELPNYPMSEVEERLDSLWWEYVEFDDGRLD